MPLVLETLSTTDSLDTLQVAIRQREELGYELVALGRGMVGGKLANLATFRRRKPGDAPSPMSLVKIDNSIDKDAQEEKLNELESGGGRLFAFAGLMVAGTEIDVATVRG